MDNRKRANQLMALAMLGMIPGIPRPGRIVQKYKHGGSRRICLNCGQLRPQDEKGNDLYGMFCQESCQVIFRTDSEYQQKKKLEKYNRGKK
jgi:hypothetical protein